MTSDRLRRAALLSIALSLAARDSSAASRAMRSALHRRALTPIQTGELLLHLSLLVGVPATLDAMELLRSLTPARFLRTDRPARTRGRRAFGSIYGNQTIPVLRKLRTLDPWVHTWVLDIVYGRVYSRPGLSLADREVVTSVILAAQGHQRQSVSHLRGALLHGVSVQELAHHLSRASRTTGADLSGALEFVATRRRL